MSAPYLPRTGLRFVRDLARSMPSELPRKSRRSLVAPTLRSAGEWDVDEDGLWVRWIDGAQWFLATPQHLADRCRTLGIGVADDPDDGYLTDRADVAEQVVAEVRALVIAASTSTPPLPTLAPAAALARRLAGAFELLPDRDVLRWRLRYAAPVLGGPGPLPPPPEDASLVPAALRSWGQRAARREPGEVITAGEVERVVRTAGYLTAHDPAPDYADVVAELRVLAGMNSVRSAQPDGPGTGWLRRHRTS